MSDEIFFIKLRDEYSMLNIDISKHRAGSVHEDDLDTLPETYITLGLEALYPTSDEANHMTQADNVQPTSKETPFDDVTIRKVIENYRKSKSKLSKLKLPAKPKPRNFPARQVVIHLGTLTENLT